MSANSQQFKNIEIPERPSVISKALFDGQLRRGLLLWGSIAAVALVALAVVAVVFSGHGEKVARLPAEAPLIKAEEQPMKVAPENAGGMQVPNRDMMVYERMHGAPGSKPPVERLLPEPEQPLAPPQPKPSAPPAEPPALARSGSERPADVEPPVATEPPSVTPVAPAPSISDTPLPAAPPSDKPPAATTTAQPKPPPSVRTPTPDKPTAATKAPVPDKPAAATKTPVPDKPTVTAKVATPEQSRKSGSGRYQVQLLAGRSADEVRSAWTKLKAKNSDLLGPLSPTLAPTQLSGRGTYYRLRAGPLESEATARALCDRLSGRGASCIIIRPGS